MSLAQRLIDGSGQSFGNGRDTVTWANYTYKAVAKKSANNPKAIRPSSVLSYNSDLDDIESALEQILESRKEIIGGQSCAST